MTFICYATTDMSGPYAIDGGAARGTTPIEGNNKISHWDVNPFPTDNGELIVGSFGLRRLAARVGRTPFYAYDRRLISARVDLLRACLPKAVHVHYAMKANPMPAVVHQLTRLVDGLDVASGREMAVALDAGTSPQHISFAGP